MTASRHSEVLERVPGRNSVIGADSMREFEETKRLLDKINRVISGYDPVLREKARDILLRETFGVHKRKRVDRPSPGMSGLASQEESPKAPQTRDIGRWEPRLQPERALLCLHDLLKTFGLHSVTGRKLSKELKDKGLYVSNISVAMERNVELQLARRVLIDESRVGTKARYEYSITSLGSLYVERKAQTDIGRWAPKLHAERALLCLHYLLKTFDSPSVTGRELSKELKDKGLRVANLSVAMTHNVELQLARRAVINDGGAAKQTRYQYSITSEGNLYVASRLNRDFATA